MRRFYFTGLKFVSKVLSYVVSDELRGLDCEPTFYVTTPQRIKDVEYSTSYISIDRIIKVTIFKNYQHLYSLYGRPKLSKKRWPILGAYMQNYLELVKPAGSKFKINSSSLERKLLLVKHYSVVCDSLFILHQYILVVLKCIF